MDRYLVIYHLDDLDADAPLAAVYPDGRVTASSADSVLVRTVRDAIRDPLTTVYTPDQRLVVGPATRHDPRGREWAGLVCAGLARRGLRGVPNGYPEGPALQEAEPPGLAY